MTSTGSEPPPEPPAGTLPFAGLLAELRDRGITVGVREHQQVTRLAERWRGVDRDAFGDAVAALLARDADEVVRIRAAFDDWANAPLEPPEPIPPRPPRRVSRLRPWHVAVLLFLVACGIAAAVKLRIDAQREKLQETVNVGKPSPPNPAPSPVYQPKPPAPPLPAPPREPAHEVSWLAGSIVAALALLVLAVRAARVNRGEWLRSYRRRVLEQKPGPHRYEYNVRPFAPPLPAEDVEDVASIVGRALEIDTNTGDTLDVEESLRETLRQGLHPQLVFEPPPRNVSLVVLQDVTWQMRPWQRKIDYFVTELARQGVRLERWYFEGSPLMVSRASRDRPVPFETVTARQSDGSLMILSTGQGLSAEAAEELGRLLAKWTFRTWINPIGNPSYWRRELAGLPVRMWPMTRGGVRAAATEVSRRQEAGVSPAGAARRGVTRADVERMQQLIALVPHPSLELAEELRSRFCTEIPEEVLLFLGAEGVFYGETIRFPPEQLKKLLDEASRDPAQARRVREYLLEVLRDSEPPAESVAHLRWQIEHAVHELHVGDDARAADARRTLHQLAQGPLGDEVEAALDLAGAPKAEELIRAARGLPDSVERETGMRHPPQLSRPKLPWTAAALLLIGVGTMVAARWWPRGEGDPIPHRVGAYTLREEPGTPNYLASAATDDAPMKAAIFRDGTLWQPIVVSPQATVAIADDDRGAWFDVRGRLGGGNLAASKPIWVPMRETPEPPAVDPRLLPPWIDDVISKRLVEMLTPMTSGRDVTPRSTLEELGITTGMQQAAFHSALRRAFGVAIGFVEIPSGITVTELAELIRAAVRARDRKPAIVTLSFFVTPPGEVVLNQTANPLRYELRSTTGRSYSGIEERPLEVPAGTYDAFVLAQTLATRARRMPYAIERERELGRLPLRAGESLVRSYLVTGVALDEPLTVTTEPAGPSITSTTATDTTGTPLETRPTSPVSVPTSTAGASSNDPPAALLGGQGNVGRRVIELLFDEFRSGLPPGFNLDTPLTDLDVDYGQLWGAIGNEFNIELDDVDIGESRTMEELISAVERKLEKDPVAVTLTFRNPQGVPLPRVKYALIGSEERYEGTGGSRLREVQPGTYRVTIQSTDQTETRLVTTIEIPAGQSFLRELTVPAEAAKRPNERRGAFRLVDPRGQEAEEVWTPTDDAHWTVTFPGGRAIPKRRTRIARAAVNGDEGIVAGDDRGTEYFIPDDGNDVLTRPPKGQWTFYRRIASTE